MDTSRSFSDRQKAEVLYALDVASEEGVLVRDVLRSYGLYSSIVSAWRRGAAKLPTLSDAERARVRARVLGETTGPVAVPADGATAEGVLRAELALCRSEVEALRRLVAAQRQLLGVEVQ